MDGIIPTNVLYRGWYDGEIARDHEHGDDATPSSGPVLSGFTAINQQPIQLLTPQSPARIPIKQNQARRRARSHNRRRHNVVVAQYLGLGSANEPRHLEQIASLPAKPDSPPAKPIRKRRKLVNANNESDLVRVDTPRGDISNQRPLPECYSVTKSIRSRVATEWEDSVSEASQFPWTYEATPYALVTDNSVSTKLQRNQSDHRVQYTIAKYNSSTLLQGVKKATVVDSQIEELIDFNEPHLEACNYETDSDQLVRLNCNFSEQKAVENVIANEDFENGIQDEELLMLTLEIENTCSRNNMYQSSSALEVNPTTPQRIEDESLSSTVNTAMIFEDTTGSKRSRYSTRKFMSPMTPTTRLLAATGDVDNARARSPIVRCPFPPSVRDRSPVIGLTSDTLLRTCFRIGEAINQGCYASKTSKQAIIELYARVFDSERTDTQQLFTFCDLFHAKPPYVKAAYSAAIWKSVELFEYDSRRLLHKGRICRCIGTMKRDGKDWVMVILNVWEATWQDINRVEGIVNF